MVGRRGHVPLDVVCGYSHMSGLHPSTAFWNSISDDSLGRKERNRGKEQTVKYNERSEKMRKGNPASFIFAGVPDMTTATKFKSFTTCVPSP